MQVNVFIYNPGRQILNVNLKMWINIKDKVRQKVSLCANDCKSAESKNT